MSFTFRNFPLKNVVVFIFFGATEKVKQLEQWKKEKHCGKDSRTLESRKITIKGHPIFKFAITKKAYISPPRTRTACHKTSFFIVSQKIPFWAKNWWAIKSLKTVFRDSVWNFWWPSDYEKKKRSIVRHAQASFVMHWSCLCATQTSGKSILT